MSYGVDDTIEEHLYLMQKDPKKRGRFVNRIAEEDSFNASVAEKTDRIINYSAVLNTSEEMIEAAVNQSSTLKANEHTYGANQSSGVNSSLLHKILPNGSFTIAKKSSERDETSIDKLDYFKLLQGNQIETSDKQNLQLMRAVSGGDERYVKE
jgi:uncharacterized protein YihD (DUF1040 family)